MSPTFFDTGVIGLMDGLFNEPGMASLQRTLHLLDARRDAISANLANVDTPGYRPVDATFAQTFDGALTPGQGSGGDAGATPVSLDAVSPIQGGGPVQAADGIALVPQPAGAMRLDGSGVDVDAQMARLSETVLWYSAVSKQLNLGFGRIQTAIQGGGQ